MPDINITDYGAEFVHTSTFGTGTVSCSTFSSLVCLAVGHLLSDWVFSIGSNNLAIEKSLRKVDKDITVEMSFEIDGKKIKL